MKKLSKWVPHELNTNQKIVVLNSHLLYYATFLNWLVTSDRVDFI